MEFGISGIVLLKGIVYEMRGSKEDLWISSKDRSYPHIDVHMV